MVLCSGIFMKIMVKEPWYFSSKTAVFTQRQGFFYFSNCPFSVEAAVIQKVGMDTVGTADPNRWEAYLYKLLLSNKSWLEWGREEYYSELSHLSSQATVRHDGLWFHGRGWTSTCWWEGVNEFLLSLCLTALISPGKLPLKEKLTGIRNGKLHLNDLVAF